MGRTPARTAPAFPTAPAPSVARKAAKVCLVVPSNTRLPAVAQHAAIAMARQRHLPARFLLHRIPGDQRGLLARIADHACSSSRFCSAVAAVTAPAAVGAEGLRLEVRIQRIARTSARTAGSRRGRCPGCRPWEPVVRAAGAGSHQHRIGAVVRLRIHRRPTGHRIDAGGPGHRHMVLRRR